MMEIRRADLSDVRHAARLAQMLWPHHTLAEMEEEMEELLSANHDAVFLAWEGGTAVGFAHSSLRRDYVEGSSYSPTGYLEGIFVVEEHRGQGVAAALLSACEQWAREQGCREFASDCELSNSESLIFHLKKGFAESNRIICFLKEL